MHRLAAALISVVIFSLTNAPCLRAAEPVDLALVLAVDVSRSIDEAEFRLQRQGYAQAFLNSRVLSAIRAGEHHRIAVCFVEWSNFDQQKVVVGWTIIGDEDSAAELSSAILAAPRSFAYSTSISAAIDFAVKQFAGSGVESQHLAIDVSGDGTNNSGRSVTAARDDAVSQGITINGLAIINERSEPFAFAHTQPPEGLGEYYRQNVIGGPGAFMVEIDNFDSFAFAIANKLVREIAEAPID